MAGESIELLKNFDAKKMPWPAMHTEKIDGVPACIIRIGNGSLSMTRQKELLYSIPHIENAVSKLMLTGDQIIMELHIAGMDFKDVSGLVRRQEPNAELRGAVFDFIPYKSTEGWQDRRHRLLDRMDAVATREKVLWPFYVLEGVICANEEEARMIHGKLMQSKPAAEGSVFHSLSKQWSPGKRCWGTQRLKSEPTIDLEIVGYVEAISETGSPLGMIGRIQALYKGNVIGIGPGKLTHKERKELLYSQRKGIAQIKYMVDPSYEALRQPTFQCWRPDKETADV